MPNSERKNKLLQSEHALFRESNIEHIDVGQLTPKVQEAIQEAILHYAAKNKITRENLKIAEEIVWQMFIDGWAELASQNTAEKPITLNGTTTRNAIKRGENIRISFLTKANLIKNIIIRSS